MDLRALLPTNRWGKGHQLLIWHGRRTCFARRPACQRCVVAVLCPKIGVAAMTRTTADYLSYPVRTRLLIQQASLSATTSPHILTIYPLSLLLRLLLPTSGLILRAIR